MKIARLKHGGYARVGIIDGEQIRLLEAGTDVLDLLAADPGERDEIVSATSTGDSVAASGAKLLAPLEPTSLRDFVTFEEHVQGFVADIPPEWSEAPIFYFTNVAAVTGPYDDVRIAPGETE